MIRGVTFDAAGTLFEPAEAVGATYARIAGRFGIAVDAAPAIEGRFRAALGAAPPLAFPGVSADALPARERAWWWEIVRRALALDHGRAGHRDCFDALYEHYGSAPAWRLFTDVVPTLEALRRAGARTGIVSNFDGRLPGLVRAFGLETRVEVVVWSTAVGAAKPDPRIFRHAASRLGLAVEELLHVGDDPRADVDGALAAGARGVLLDRTTWHRGAVRSLHEVPASTGLNNPVGEA